MSEPTELYLEEFPLPSQPRPSLKKLGFAEVRQRGSHVVLRKETEHGEVGCVVPRHKELAVGTLRGILKQAKVAEDEFVGQF